jgi:hypothetical protein
VLSRIGLLQAARGGFSYESWVRADPENRSLNYVPVVVIDNSSDEIIYDLRARVVVPDLLSGEFGVMDNRLLPGATEHTRFETSIEEHRWWAAMPKNSSGVQMTFTDGRGVRWLRGEFGRLVPRKANAHLGALALPSSA